MVNNIVFRVGQTPLIFHGFSGAHWKMNDNKIPKPKIPSHVSPNWTNPLLSFSQNRGGFLQEKKNKEPAERTGWGFQPPQKQGFP